MLSVTSNNKSSTSSASASASTIGNSSDILIKILYCLPVKSLCLFKIVSKQWQSLISDPYFGRNYNLQSHHRLSMAALFMKKTLIELGEVTESEFETLVMDERNGIDYVLFNTPIAFEHVLQIFFAQSCNGLILYKSEDAGYHTRYAICNPSMRRCKKLTWREPDVSLILSASIAFDPAKSSYFEIVGVRQEDTSKDICHIEIYSSKTDSWRAAGYPFPFTNPGTLAQSGVYWNGSVHWIDKWSGTLYYYDIDCELMKKIATPTDPMKYFGRSIVYFNECRGKIHLMETCKYDMPLFDIWEMRTDYTGWNHMYYVDLSPLTTVYPGRFDLYVLLIDETEDSSRLILWRDKVISFDLKKKSLKKLYDVNPDVSIQGFHYIETLAHS